MANIDDPHFAFPFALDFDGQPRVVDQGSEIEIEDCVAVLLMTQRGERIDEPDYGIPDPTFLEGGIEVAALAGAISRWEDRLASEVSQTSFEDYTQRIRVRLIGRDASG